MPSTGVRQRLPDHHLTNTAPPPPPLPLPHYPALPDPSITSRIPSMPLHLHTLGGHAAFPTQHHPFGCGHIQDRATMDRDGHITCTPPFFSAWAMEQVHCCTHTTGEQTAGGQKNGQAGGTLRSHWFGSLLPAHAARLHCDGRLVCRSWIVVECSLLCSAGGIRPCLNRSSLDVVGLWMI